MKFFVKMGVLIIILITALGMIPILAQNNDIVLTVGIEEWHDGLIKEELFADFEAAHPNVKVVTVVISQSNRSFASPITPEGVPDFLDNAANLAGKADLLGIQSYTFNRSMALAGAYLDITPLMNADPDANIEDFYPAMLQSFQWDGATWALPISGSTQIVVYNKTHFDELGISYPNETWTLNDYIQIGRELTVYDADGKVDLPGFFGFDNAVFLQAVYGHSLSDSSTIPTEIRLTEPELVQLVEQWASYQADIYPEAFDFDYMAIPMTLQGTYFLDPNRRFGANEDVWAGTLLPNGTASVQVQGYAISSGTQYPELSYELLQYMTQSPDIAFAFYNSNPARKSLEGAVALNVPAIISDPSPELDELNRLAMANAIPMNEREFYFYIELAVHRINSGGKDVEVALQELENEINDTFRAIVEQSNSSIIAVATPVPTPVLTANEVSLTFGLQPNFVPMANRDQWLAAIDEFVAQDPQVAQIVLETDYVQFDERIETQDCFYLPSNPLNDADLSSLLSVEPFLAADANFDPNDLVAGALEQMTRNGIVWGIPMSLDPLLLWYNPNDFVNADVPLPENDWSVFEFIDSLQQVTANIGKPAYETENFGSTYLLMFVAAFGGDVLDSSQGLFHVNLTDPNNVEAIRQVLDLSKDGYMAYIELGEFYSSAAGSGSAMFDSRLTLNAFRLQNRQEGVSDPYRTVLFPSGTTYRPLSYTLGGGFISANTAAPEACYRFLSFIWQRVELLLGMPTKQSQLAETAGLIYDSEDLVAVYEAFAEALQKPDVLVVPDVYSGEVSNPKTGISNFLIVIWMNRAFDAYVLEDADLEIALADSQQLIDEYTACIADIDLLDRPLSELTDEEALAYFTQFQNCAIGVDPTFNELFGGGG